MYEEEGGRKAPYAPVSALREFFAKIADTAVPRRVDRAFLQKLRVASSNEWALLSALKYLGVVDDRGHPTPAYRRLQAHDSFQETLRYLVEQAYKELLDVGGLTKSSEDLVDYFRRFSSASQARNAARFFREITDLAGMREAGSAPEPSASPLVSLLPSVESSPAAATPPPPSSTRQSQLSILEAKAKLLEKLPTPRPEWSAAEYEAICGHFVEMLRLLDGVPSTS